jgi:hypothetical protein
VTVRAHFDGRVIVPDEPLDLAPNQVVLVEIRTVPTPTEPNYESALEWLAANAVDSDELPVDLAEHHDYYLYGVHNEDANR